MATIELGAPPATAPLFVKAALGVVPRPWRPRELPETALVLPEQVIDRDHVAAYARACGFPLSDQLPVIYPHVLGFGLALRLMTSQDFPFPLLGLVHIRNRIVAHRAIGADEPITLGVRAAGLAAHDRGTQFALTTEATVDDNVVWSEESTYLRRSGAGQPRGAAGEPTNLPQPTAVWRLTKDAGRRYAAISGDYNPIHLHRLTARAFGFPRAIAHGMYTAARCLAALDPRLPERYTVDVRFGRPALLPSTVQVRIDRADGGWNLAVHNPDGRPHLTGTISPDG
ncbi:MAG TPA: MaoC/PaaZ C-terminal domain-containing protein [Pseudonocardiaceae bacterium]